MPRRSKTPSHRLHKASAQAIVTLDDTTHYLGKYESPKSRAKYAEIIKQWSART